MPVTFLSDYGLEDEFVGVCHGVIARVAHDLRVIDLGHGVPRGDVRQGALRLADALPFTLAGVHLAVVDPGVGGDRRAVAIRCGSAPVTGDAGGWRAQTRILVGPDNGLLMAAARRCGGVEEAVEIGESPFRLDPVSATFHGRDIFAPVAAHLALGAPLEAVGKPIAVESLVELELPPARVILSCEGNLIETEVLAVDSFGNASLSATADDLLALAGGEESEEERPEGSGPLPDSVTIDLASRSRRVPLRPTFTAVPPDKPVLVVDSSDRLALAINQSSAANRFSLAPGDPLRLR